MKESPQKSIATRAKTGAGRVNFFKSRQRYFFSGFFLYLVTFENCQSLLLKFPVLKIQTPALNQDLVNACRSGDRDAQFRIYKLYYKTMYNTSLRIVNDSAEAEDIMQESFLDAFQRLDTYTGEGTFGSWLKRIVINRSLDCLRKHKDEVPLEEVGIDLSDEPDQDFEEEVMLQVTAVKQAIAELPDEYRIVVTLLLIEGYDHEEVAQVLKITNQLSRTRYSRARQKLLEILKRNNHHKAFSYN